MRGTSWDRDPGADRAGFTLIELLVVVVVIGILAAIAIPKFSEARGKAFRSAMMSDLRNLAQHQEIYFDGADLTYSSDLGALGAELSDGVDVQVTEAHNRGWAAVATHAGLAPEDRCGIFHGAADPANGAPATTEGVVMCSF